MNRLIGISGKMGAGKDEVTKIVNEITVDRYEVMRFSGKLKKIAEVLTGIPYECFNDADFKFTWLHEYNMTIREFLQKLGSDAMRDGLHKDIWVKSLFTEHKQESFWIIPDVRFPNEYEEIKRRGGVIVRIERAGPREKHSSETALDNHSFDYRIKNNATLTDLKYEVAKMLLSI